jgi:hypothetical protein
MQSDSFIVCQASSFLAPNRLISSNKTHPFHSNSHTSLSITLSIRHLKPDNCIFWCEQRRDARVFCNLSLGTDSFLRRIIKEFTCTSCTLLQHLPPPIYNSGSAAALCTLVLPSKSYTFEFYKPLYLKYAARRRAAV